MVVEVDLVAELAVTDPFDFFLDEETEHVPFAYPPLLKHDLLPYLQTASFGLRFAEFVEGARSGTFMRGRRSFCQAGV